MYEVFEHLLQSFGVSAYKFCKDTGIPQSTISTWKKKRNLINGEMAKKIADYFGVSVDYLLIIYGIIHHYKSFVPKMPHVKKIKKRCKNLLTIGVQ